MSNLKALFLVNNLYSFYRLERNIKSMLYIHSDIEKTSLLRKCINKALKNVLIQTELVQVHNNLRWYDYKHNEISTINNLIPKKYDDLCRNIECCRYQKIKRIDKRIEYYLSLGTCYFITLTFRDDVLNNTTKKTRRDYVRKFFKSNFKHYIANIDYGDSTHREHYHGIIYCDVDIIKWKYGFFKYDLIRTSEEDKKRLSQYITKLRNHSLKASTENERIIYSRDR